MVNQTKSASESCSEFFDAEIKQEWNHRAKKLHGCHNMLDHGFFQIILHLKWI